jgi:hypothetical protein
MSQELDLNININTKGTEVIGIFRKELKEANGELLKAQTLYGDYSNEAIKAAQKVALLKDKIQEARETSDLFDPGKKFQALTGTLSAVAGGFGAIQGAMAIFGAESDNVQKALLRVNAAMALSQGLSTIKDSIKDFERLGTIIKANTVYQQANNVVNVIATTIMRAFGVSVDTTSVAFTRLKIAIAATGIGLLVAGIAVAVTAFENFTGAAQKAEDAQKKLNKQIEDGAKVQLEGELTYLDREQKLAVARAKAKGNSEAEIYKIEQTYRQLKIDAQQRYHNEIANIDAKAAASTQNTIKNIVNEAEIARLAEQERLRKVAEQKEKDDKKKADELIAFNLRAKLQVQADDLALLEDGKKLQAEADKADAEAAKAAEEDRIKGLQYRTAQVIDINKAAQDRDKADKDALTQAEKQFQNAKFDIANQGLNLIQQLAGQGTAVAKAAALSQIIIDTGRGFASGLTIAQEGAKATGPAAPFAFPIFYATQIAAVLGAVGKAKSILSQVPGGGGIGGSISAPTMAQAPITPQAPQPATTNISQESINDLGNKAIRSYVVESDITNSQKRVASFQNQSSFS